MEDNEPDSVFSYFVTLCYVKLLRGFLIIDVTEIKVILVCELEHEIVKDDCCNFNGKSISAHQGDFGWCLVSWT
jgi:hypothetical protein